MKIHQVHQKLEAKQFLLFCETCFLFVIHLNFKLLGFSGEPMTQHTCQSCTNMNHMRMLKNSLPHHATLNHIMIHVATIMQTLKMNTTSVRHINALELAHEHAH